MSGYLSAFAENKTSPHCVDCPGYNILNEIKMPFDGAVGDRIGLFPIAYLARYERGGPDRQPYDRDMIAQAISNYILPWPYRLNDTAQTFARKVKRTILSFPGLPGYPPSSVGVSIRPSSDHQWYICVIPFLPRMAGKGSPRVTSFSGRMTSSWA